jgi:HSP20 family molecular chaperone IbpA
MSTSSADVAPQPVPVNMYEAEEALVVVAPLPGVMEDDIEIVVDSGKLTISAALRSPAPKDYILHEWTYGPYRREVEIPAGFGGEATASFGNGQLAVRVLREGSGGGRVVVHPAD